MKVNLNHKFVISFLTYIFVGKHVVLGTLERDPGNVQCYCNLSSFIFKCWAIAVALTCLSFEYDKYDVLQISL